MVRFFRRASRGRAEQSVIEAVSPGAPGCILRNAQRPGDRSLTITGRNFPRTNHGLQFQHVSTGDLSIIFDMEVHWESARRITLDMGTISDLLWPDDPLTLRVRIFDTENANYRPISDWSEPFLLVTTGKRAADNAASPAIRAISAWPELIAELEAHGFYDYAEPEWRDRAKELTLETSFLSSRSIDDLTGRAFSSDAESLAEGGVVDFLEKVAPVLERQGIQIDARQEWSVDRQDYPVTVNGRAYLIYSEHDLGGMGYWVAAVIRTLALVNTLLEEASSPERIYALRGDFGGEGSRSIFLTPALYQIIRTCPLIAEQERLFTVEEMMPWLE